MADINKNATGLWETIIDDHTYEFEKWGAEKATDVLLDLTAVLGQPLGAAAQMVKDKTTPGLAIENVAQLVGRLTSVVGEKKALCKHLIKTMATDGLCNGKAVVFNSHYADRLEHMFKVVAVAFEVQYGNFFAAARRAAGLNDGPPPPEGISPKAA